jgi:N-acetyl-S-(2-succino)cysteine monooxygenase
MVEVFRNERITVREYISRQPLRGPHRVIVGTPKQVADSFVEWFELRAADGFNVGNLSLGSLSLFVDEVVPILQRRGVYRNEYRGRTLRENFLEI